MCCNKWHDSHRAYAKFISVISICPSAHNLLFVITLIHRHHTPTHTHAHTHIPLMLQALKRQTHPHFQQYPIKHKAEGRIRSRLVLHNAPIRDHTGFKLPPSIPHSFSITHWPNKVCFSNKKDQQRNTESQFCATAVPYNPQHCVFVSGKLSTSIMDMIGPFVGLKFGWVESEKKTFPLDGWNVLF